MVAQFTSNRGWHRKKKVPGWQQQLQRPEKRGTSEGEAAAVAAASAAAAERLLRPQSRVTDRNAFPDPAQM